MKLYINCWFDILYLNSLILLSFCFVYIAFWFYFDYVCCIRVSYRFWGNWC